MNKRELEARLLEIFSEALPIIKKNNDVRNLNNSIFCSFKGNGLIIAMDSSEKDKLDAPAKYLLSLEMIQRLYSDKYIENLIFGCYATALDDENKLNHIVNEFINEILSNKGRHFLIISELANIKIPDDRTYNIIESIIKNIKSEDLPFDSTRIKMPRMNLLNKPAIMTRVSVGEEEKAKEIALHRFLVAINLIRLYFPSLRPVLKGVFLSRLQNLIVYNYFDKSVSASIERIGDPSLGNAIITPERYAQMLELGIGELLKESEISKVVKGCLYWYGLGLDEKFPAAQLVNFVTVLESALKREGENTELRRAVSERGAILLKDDFKDRKKAYKELKDIYDERSNVVHTGRLIENKALASRAGRYARDVIMALIEKARAFDGNFEEFINNLDDTKLGKAEKRSLPKA